MNIRTIDAWDDAFFKDFIQLRTQLYEGHPDFLPETLEEFRLFFAKDSAFAKTMSWKAVLITDQAKDGTPDLVARYLLSMHPESDFLSFGFFETKSAAGFLKAEIFKDFAYFKTIFPKLSRVDGPIQGSMFAGFRFREPSQYPRFLGESLHKEHYPKLWETWGFTISGYWNSHSLPIQSGISFYKSMGERLQHLWQDPRIVCRGLNQKKWDEEVASIYEVTTAAYQLQGTNHQIDLSIFAALSAKIRPLVTSKTVRLLEYEGKVVGFTICYIDIQEEIRRYNLRKKSWPNLVNKLMLFAQIKFRSHPLLLYYVAKTPTAPIKWAVAKLCFEALKDIHPEQYTSVVSALNAENAGSRSSLPPDKVLISRHFLMTRSLQDLG